jgi:hypothetical protein
MEVSDQFLAPTPGEVLVKGSCKQSNEHSGSRFISLANELFSNQVTLTLIIYIYISYLGLLFTISNLLR